MDYNNLDWGWAGSLVDKTPSQGDVSSTYKSVLQALQATQQNADLLKALGFSGQALNQPQLDPNMDYGTNGLFNGSGEFTPEALKWLDANGYSLGVGHEPGTKEGGRSEYWGLLDPSGKYLAGQTDPIVSQSSANPWAEWAMMALPLVTMGTSAALSGVGEGIGTLGGIESGVSSLGSMAPELTAPLSTAGSQAAATQLSLGGIPGLEIAGGAGALGASGIGTLGGLGYEAPSMLGSMSPELTAPLSTAGSDAAFTQLIADPVLSPNMGLPSLAEYNFKPLPELGSLGNAVAPSLIDSALSGVGSKLVDTVTSPGGIASLIGAAAGAASGGGDKTSTVQSQIDPRMQQYLYGSGYGDKNSLLGAAQNLYQSNPTGINQTMQQGLDMQRQSLLDPAYAQGYQQMRNLGSSLLSGFGQSPTVQPGGGLVNTADRTKALIARGQGLLG